MADRIVAYRERAVACDNWATRVRDEAAREQLLGLAAEWRRRASQVERFGLSTPSVGSHRFVAVIFTLEDLKCVLALLRARGDEHRSNIVPNDRRRRKTWGEAVPRRALAEVRDRLAG